MASSWLMEYFPVTGYFNFSIILFFKSCDHSADQDSFDTRTDKSRSYASIEVLEHEDSSKLNIGSTLENIAQWVMNLGHDLEKSDIPHTESLDECEDILNTALGVSASKISLILTFVVLSASCTALLLAFKVVKRFNFGGRIKLLQGDSASKLLDSTSDNSVADTETKLEDDIPEFSETSSTALDSNILSTRSDTQALQMPVIIRASLLNRSYRVLSDDYLIKPDGSHLLSCTCDHFLMELDHILGLTAAQAAVLAENESSATTSLPSSHLPRKGSIRRPRWRSPLTNPCVNLNPGSEDPAAQQMWQKIDKQMKKIRWAHLDGDYVDVNQVKDSRLSALLQFYEQTCPVPVKQWHAACLIVNYILALLHHELSSQSNRDNSVKVLEFRSFGSAANKTCISRANRFDVLLVLQVPSCTEIAIHHYSTCDEIPAGKLILGMKEVPSETGRSCSLLSKDKIGSSFGMFLSHREVVKATQKLVASVLERLRSKNKTILDRLPFSVHLAPYEDLLLCIDTKILNSLGFGVSEITVRLVPAICVTSQECDPLPSLYAVPPWMSMSENTLDLASRSRIQSRILRNSSQGVPADLLWQLNCSEITSSFMERSAKNLQNSGILGCQVVCQQILRALFSYSGKGTLLKSGEVHPYILDSIVCFLLLESPLDAWHFSCLPDRVSDCVKFLQSALDSTWMPDFVIHNPHLLKRLPALKFLPFLTGRQENILASVRPETVETIRGFIDARLLETGLQKCMNAEYSTEMWEYEFFIFG